jgi:SAM-dependent methyltransferase
MWNSGYVSDVDYTFGHFSFLSPNSLKLAALLEGGKHSVPEDPTYLELGFGQGVSLNMHAASNPGQYWGADFSPSQTATASEYAEHGAGNLQLFEDSFEDLLRRRDLPQFDIIVLHGIWSWVPRKARKAITHIARDHLKPGGLFYVSYNVKAGWEGTRSLRDLMAQHYRTNRRGSVAERVKAALTYATEVLEADAKFFSNNPIAKAQLEDMKKKDPVYIAHEFFNETWNPMHFSEVCEELSHAKLDHLGSSTLLDGLESIHLTPKAQEILRGASDKRIKGDLWDAFVSQRFRRDIFVKGLRAHIPQSRLRLLLKQRFVLTKLAEKLPATIKGARGTANLDQDLYGRIVRAFSEANAYILSVQDILASPECTSIPFAQLEQAIRVLVDIDMIAPVSSEETITSVKPATERLNIKLCQDAAFDDSVKFLASPVIGSGVAVSRFEQLFIISLSRGLADPSKYIWQLFEAQGQRLQKEGKLLETAEANQAELQSQLDAFRENRLPLLHRLGIVSAEGKLDLSCEEPLKG